MDSRIRTRNNVRSRPQQGKHNGTLDNHGLPPLLFVYLGIEPDTAETRQPALDPRDPREDIVIHQYHQ